MPGPFKMTVIIPTYNRCEILKKCLDALESQTLSSELYDIIVVDDGSMDATGETVTAFGDKSHLSVKYFRQENSGQNAARNRAMKFAEGDLVIFINDDTISTRSMLEQHRKVHMAQPGSNIAVLGKIARSPEIPSNIFAAQHLDSVYRQWEGKKILNWRAFYTCNLSVKKEYLLRNGLFNEKLRYNDDIELGERLSHSGLEIVYQEAALGYHHHYISEKDYFNLAAKNGKSLAAWFKESPHLKKELAAMGLYTEKSSSEKIKYLIADWFLGERLRHLAVSLARFFANHNQRAALLIYNKLYKAIERESIRNELYGE